MPDVVAMAITSKSPGLGELLVSDWKASGLLLPSAIKLSFATIEQRLIIRPLGMLDKVTKAALKREIGKIFE
jgi:hypothetical protein